MLYMIPSILAKSLIAYLLFFFWSISLKAGQNALPGDVAGSELILLSCQAWMQTQTYFEDEPRSLTSGNE